MSDAEELRAKLTEIVRSVMTDPATIENMVQEALRLVESGGTGRLSTTLDIREAREAEFVAMGIPSGRSIPHSPRVRHVMRALHGP